SDEHTAENDLATTSFRRAPDRGAQPLANDHRGFRDHAGAAAGRARSNDRRHRHAPHRGGSQRLVLLRLGDHRLPGRLYRDGAGRRQARGPVWPEAIPADRHGRLRRRLGSLRSLAEHDRAHHLPHHPGNLRRRPLCHRLRRHWRSLPGAAALVAGLIPLMVALSIARDPAWTSPEVLGLLIGSAVMLVLFFVLVQRSDNPIVPFRLFNDATFSVSMLTSFLTGFAMFGAIIFVPLIYQGVLGVTATNSGQLLTPMMLGL